MNLLENDSAAGVEVGACPEEGQIGRRKMSIGITVPKRGLNLMIQIARGTGAEVEIARGVVVLKGMIAKETRIDDEG